MHMSKEELKELQERARLQIEEAKVSQAKPPSLESILDMDAAHEEKIEAAVDRIQVLDVERTHIKRELEERLGSNEEERRCLCNLIEKETTALKTKLSKAQTVVAGDYGEPDNK